MTDIQIGLTVMSAVVAGVSLFGAFWLRIERRQAAERNRLLNPSQLVKQETLELATAGRDR
jgi:hypothetical protein